MSLTIATRLRFLRKKAGFTQAALADKIKMDRTQYSRLESGRQVFGMIFTLRRIAQALGVNINDLVIGTHVERQVSAAAKESK